jgi:hypothetical protein
MKIAICQICKDPIWSFLCLDCLARQLSGWFPRKISIDFLKFHRNFVRYFQSGLLSDSDSSLRCLNCKRVGVASVCPFCYVTEVVEWLRDVNMDMSARLARLLPFGARQQKIEPITGLGRQKFDQGICELCETYSEMLVLRNGKWVCKECEEIEY